VVRRWRRGGTTRKAHTLGGPRRGEGYEVSGAGELAPLVAYCGRGPKARRWRPWRSRCGRGI